MVKMFLAGLGLLAMAWRVWQWLQKVGDVDWSLPFEAAVTEEWKSWTPSV